MAETKNLQPVQVIAKIFGVTTRRVEQLTAEGIIQGEGRPKKYDLLPTIQKYIKYLSDKAHGREQKQTTAELEEEKLRAEVAIKKAKAEMAELQAKEMRGELHKAEDVEAITTDHVLFFRSMLMGMPGKLAVDCANSRTAPETADLIRREVNFILSEMTEYRYDPDEYKKRVAEREGWRERTDDGD